MTYDIRLNMQRKPFQVDGDTKPHRQQQAQLLLLNDGDRQTQHRPLSQLFGIDVTFHETRALVFFCLLSSYVRSSAGVKKRTLELSKFHPPDRKSILLSLLRTFALFRSLFARVCNVIFLFDVATHYIVRSPALSIHSARQLYLCLPPTINRLPPSPYSSPTTNP